MRDIDFQNKIGSFFSKNDTKKIRKEMETPNDLFRCGFLMIILMGFLLCSISSIKGEEPDINEAQEEQETNILLFNKIADSEAGYAFSDLGLYQSQEIFSPAIIRGQSSNYWNTVYQSSPTFIAQANTAASTAPALQGAGGSPVYTQPGSSVAPPITTSTGTTGSIAMNPTPTTGNTYTEPVNKFVRFCSKISAEYTYIPKGSKDSGLGLHEFDFYSRFMIPCSILPPSPEGGTGGSFFIAPNFSLELWNDPDRNVYGALVMPKQTFDFGVDFGIDSQFTRDFGVEAWVRVGMASSFKKIASKSFYLRGRAMGTLGITGDGRFAATLGAIYYDRNHYKLLPSGGVIWKPNDTNVWRIVFPDPRLSRHLGKINETDWWGHIQGNIGGGRWYIQQPWESFNIDYNDYRIGIGASFQTRTGFTGNFEVGGAFGRELYAYKTALYKPKSTIYLKVGLNY